MLVHGVEYSEPEVFLLQDTGIGVPEIAARTCYDSFDNSENQCIKDLNDLYNIDEPNDMILNHTLNDVNDINSSNLLHDLAWTHFHHSILEHTNISFLIKGTSRGVLQEHARHRMQNISVRSTRYTMASVINAFVASYYVQGNNGKDFFIEKIEALDMFVTSDNFKKLEIGHMFDMLEMHLEDIGNSEFLKIAIAKSSLDFVANIKDSQTLYNTLESGKKKRNVGDAFKGYLVNDSWKVDMVVTMNLRGLKNYFGLRDSGAAYIQIQWLAQQMKRVTPKKYLDLIVKSS